MIENDDFKDNLFYSNKKILKKIFKTNEKLVWSGILKVIRPNKLTKKKPFILSNFNLYKLNSRKNFLKSWVGINFKSKINLEKINNITISKYSNNFIWHISNDSEKDYYFTSPKKFEFLNYLFYSFKLTNKNSIKFIQKEEVDLSEFVKYKNKKPKNYLLGLETENMNFESFKKFINDKNNILKNDITKGDIVIKKSKKISEKDFEIIKMLGEGSYGKVFLAKKKDDGKLYALKVI